MKIKIYLLNGSCNVVRVNTLNDVKTIANKYERWEYVL